MLQRYVSFYYTAKRISRSYACTPSLWVPFSSGHHCAVSTVPCAIQNVLVSYLFYTCVILNLIIPPIHPLPRGIQFFVFYVCVSASALQLRSSTPFL